MADKDTVSPYDDEVVDPYAADDTKNPHDTEAGSEGDDEETTGGEASDEKTPRRATRASKTAKKK